MLHLTIAAQKARARTLTHNVAAAAAAVAFTIIVGAGELHDYFEISYVRMQFFSSYSPSAAATRKRVGTIENIKEKHFYMFVVQDQEQR